MERASKKPGGTGAKTSENGSEGWDHPHHIPVSFVGGRFLQGTSVVVQLLDGLMMSPTQARLGRAIDYNRHILL